MVCRSLLILFFVILFGTTTGQNIQLTIDSLEATLKSISDPGQRIETLLRLTKITRNIYPDKAGEYAARAYNMTKMAGLTDQYIRSMIEIGWIMITQAKIDSSLRITLKAKQMAEQYNLERERGMALLVIGINHIYLGDFRKSLVEFFTALTIFERIKDQEGIILSLNSLGSFCYKQGNNDKATNYFTRALEKARTLNNSELIAVILNNIGLVLVDKNENAKAVEYYSEAITRNQKTGQLFRLAANYINLANIYSDEKKFELFLIYYRKATDISLKIGNIHNLSVCYLNLADYYFNTNFPDSAIFYSKISFRNGLSNNLKEVVTNSATQLETFYQIQKQTDSAYKYATIRYQYKDSLEQEMNSTRLIQLELQNQYESSAREEKLKQQKKDVYITFIITLIVAVLIITVLFLSRQIVKTKNIRLEKKILADDLDFKNRELAINVMNLLKKHEFLLDHTNRLVEIQEKAGEENIKSDILYLISNLQRDSGTQIWDEFELRFRQVHSGFYERLLKNYPDLTSSELKLCALLRLNLSTKEICELTGQRPASLDVARSRLRKKLGFTSSQTSLITFLTQI